MRDPGEKVSQTLKREFMEEALNVLKLDEDEKQKIAKRLSQFFEDGTEVSCLLAKIPFSLHQYYMICSLS